MDLKSIDQSRQDQSKINWSISTKRSEINQPIKLLQNSINRTFQVSKTKTSQSTNSPLLSDDDDDDDDDNDDDDNDGDDDDDDDDDGDDDENDDDDDDDDDDDGDAVT